MAAQQAATDNSVGLRPTSCLSCHVTYPKESLATPPPSANFGACRQQSRSAKASRRRPSSWCVAFLDRPPGMISCIASTSGRKSTPGSRTSERAVCIRTRRFGRNLRSDDRLVLRSSAVASCDSTLHRAGFRILCRADDRSHYRAGRARSSCSRPRSPGARVSRGAVEGSPRVSLSYHLPVFRRGIVGRDDRALQSASRKNEGNANSKGFAAPWRAAGRGLKQARAEGTAGGGLRFRRIVWVRERR